MKIRHAHNGGLAEVSDEYGQRLIDAGLWKPADAPVVPGPDAPPPPKPKPGQKPTQRPKPPTK